MSSPLPGVTLALSTVTGTEDLLIEEVGHLGRAETAAPGIVDLDPGSPEDWPGLLVALADRRFYTGAALKILTAHHDQPQAADHDQTRIAVSSLIMALSALGVQGPAGFRIQDTDADRRCRLADQVASITGWQEQPRDWVINISTSQDGWSVDIGPLHWSRRHLRLERLPWSTPVVLAEVMVRLAKVGPEHRLLDPCCGSGTILVAAGLSGVGPMIGIDTDQAAVDTAEVNLDRAGLRAEVRHGDAVRTELPDGSVDRVISNLPFGKQVGSHAGNQQLYPQLLGELTRVLSVGGRAVLLTEDKRLLLDAVQRTAGLKIVRQRVLRYSGANPTAYVISRTRSGSSRSRR